MKSRKTLGFTISTVILIHLSSFEDKAKQNKQKRKESRNWTSHLLHQETG